MDDIMKSEQAIFEKLDEITKALLKRLADKQETKKTLIYLDKRVNNLNFNSFYK